jgi:poly(3-hydroxyoctanoate) depolymerase
VSSLETFSVTVGGSRLRVASRGDGPPVLLVNGVGANLGIWGPLARRLHGRRIISFDMPGMGGSEPARSTLRLRGMAELTGDLIAELGYEQVDVVGQSLGGMISLELAHRAPRRIRKLVLCNTGAGMPAVPGLNPLAWAGVLTPIRSKLLTAAAAGGRTSRERGLTSKMVGTRADRPSWSALWRQLYAVPGWTSWPWLHRVRHPTLIVAGGSDPLVPPANSRLLAWRMPDARLHVVPGGGHLLTADQPDIVGELINEFIN